MIILKLISIIAIFWLLYRLLKAFFKLLFKNTTKETLKVYLDWANFAQTLKIESLDDFKKALKKIKSKKIYQGKFKKIYLSKNEAIILSEDFKELTIKDILEDKVSLISLGKRLERITLYDHKDLKNIKKSSKMIWSKTFDIDIHMIIDNKKIIYPVDFPKDNQFKFGYELFKDENGLFGLYDVDEDILKLEFKYTSIENFANIAEVTEDKKTYELYDLKENELLQINDEKIFPNIKYEFKQRIDLSKLELEDYMFLHNTPKSRFDLEILNLWGAKVGVHRVPENFEEVLEDTQSGIIQWNNYCSADIFDMSVELPINFKKKNGDYVSLGIHPKYLVLEKKFREDLTPLEKEKEENMTPLFEVWIDDNEDRYGNNRYVDGEDDLSYFIDKFGTRNEAISFIENKIDEVLKELAIKAKSVEELKSMDISQSVSYFIKKKDKSKEFFKTWQYIQDNAQRIFEELKKAQK